MFNTPYLKRPKVQEFVIGPVWSERSWLYYESVEDFPKIRDNDHSLGFVYVVEHGDMVKIGFTANPHDRFLVKYKPAFQRGYEAGRVFISPAHRQYIETEHALHKSFADLRISGTELFKIKFSENIPTMMCMALETNDFYDKRLW